LQTMMDADAALDLPPSLGAAMTEEAYRGLVNASLARSTWAKYASGWKAFCEFEQYHQTSFGWPLAAHTWRAFAVWCVSAKKLQPSSTRSYISSLKFVHHLRGLPCSDTTADPVVGMILRGAKNMAFAMPPKPQTRRVVTLPLLLTIGHRIGKASWPEQRKQVLWTACTTAFFPSARLGELLASNNWTHDPTADLLWGDIRQNSEDSFLIRLKNPKSGEEQGEFLDIFPFPGYQCCPVASLKALQLEQMQAGLFSPDTPVFRFASGENLTTSRFNEILADLLHDICSKDTNTITCHSFRAGVPTALSLHPDLANSEDIKGWGRWNSDCYTRYTRLRHDQKRAIFDKIATALTL